VPTKVLRRIGQRIFDDGDGLGYGFGLLEFEKLLGFFDCESALCLLEVCTDACLLLRRLLLRFLRSC